MEEIVALPPELEEQLDASNYRSMHEDMEAAKGELDRYREKGFAVLLDKGEASEAFGSGTVSRLALISKMKEGPQGRGDEAPDHHRHAQVGRQQEIPSP